MRVRQVRAEVTASSSADSVAAWDALVASQSGGSFYHLHAWKRLNERHFGHAATYLTAQAGGSVTGILPLVLTRSRIFGRILCSMPFVNYGGPVAVDSEATRLLVDAAQEHARSMRADYLELRCAAPLDIDLPVSTQKISMTVDLDADPECLWSRFSSKHRTAIRRAYKDGLTVASGGMELLPAFYRVMEHSWRDLGTPLYGAGIFPRNRGHVSGSDACLHLQPRQ